MKYEVTYDVMIGDKFHVRMGWTDLLEKVCSATETIDRCGHPVLAVIRAMNNVRDRNNPKYGKYGWHTVNYDKHVITIEHDNSDKAYVILNFTAKVAE